MEIIKRSVNIYEGRSHDFTVYIRERSKSKKYNPANYLAVVRQLLGKACRVSLAIRKFIS